MKADRLLSILLLLQTRGQVPATELAERLEVSVRTIYRDIEALSAAGVPVWTERGRHGGINLLPGYRTDVTGLTSDESRALFVLAAEGSHRELGLGDAITSALRKVMAALPAPHRPAAERTSERILIDPARWMQRPAHSAAALGELQQAVFADRQLHLTYRHSGDTDPSQYTVDPYGLVSKAGVWYLVADLDANPRLFRVDRVQAAATSPTLVRRRPGLTLTDVWTTLRDQVERVPTGIHIHARARHTALDLLLRIHAPRIAVPPTPVDDEWSHLTFAFGSIGATRTLLPFGTDVEVLDPPEARAELACAAREIAEFYG